MHARPPVYHGIQMVSGNKMVIAAIDPQMKCGIGPRFIIRFKTANQEYDQPAKQGGRPGCCISPRR